MANGRQFVTAEELDFMNNYCEIVDATDFYQAVGSRRLPPTRIQLRNLDQLPQASLDENVGKIFDIFIRYMLQKEGGNLETTRYWLNLRHPEYAQANGFWILHKSYPMADGHTLINSIADVMQSNESVGLDETMTLTMRIFKQDVRGRGGRTPDRILKAFGVKRNYVRGDGYCLLKALLIGKEWSDRKTAATPAEAAVHNNNFLKFIRFDRDSAPLIAQEDAAIQLLMDAGMDVDEEDHDLEDLRMLMEFFEDYHVIVWTMEEGVAFPTVIFDENQQARGCIPLYYYDGHFDFFEPTVTNVQARFCFKCNSLAEKHHYRNCKALCKRCGFLDCKKEFTDNRIYCPDCNIHFLTQNCYDQHLLKKSTRALPHCEVWEKCKRCCKIHRRPTPNQTKHQCFMERFCKICMQMIKGDHKCSHAKPSEASIERALKKQEHWTFLIYDFECQVTKEARYQNGVFGMKHLPNLLCYRMICHNCMGKDCEHCERGHFSYMTGGVGSVVEQFTKFLISSPKLENAYVIAHNGGRYDHVLSMEQMLKEEIYDQKFLLSGTTILSAQVKVGKKNTLVFRDSVKYLQMPLDQLPKAFNLETKEKGTFPYMYNHPDHYHTVLPHHPPIEYYEPNRKGVKKREELLKWYDEVKDREFDFDKEILEYCQTDVDILTEAIVKFIETCDQTNTGKWNPIVQSPTLPSFLMFLMSHEHIQDGDIGYIPENGWPGRNNSTFALKYILWLEQEKPWLKLQHKLRRGDEREILTQRTSYFVDAFNEETNEIFEVYGCLWHGCIKCFPNQENECPRNRDCTMGELYEKTMIRERDLREAGYLVHVVWECEINQMLRRDPEMAEFFKKCRHTHTLRPREAMYGGRTQQFQSLFIANDEYDAEYYDFCSEYPKVNMKGGEYPRGIPEIINFDFVSIKNGEPLPYKGLIFCDVLPPLQCALPVLPYRGNGKLLFPLCATCANSKKPPQKCPHTNVSDRYLTGVWCYDELNLAISEGYTILRYHEVWHWSDEQWFRGGFFASFMKPLLKMKHAASGWPRDDMTAEEKQAHVDAIRANDGVELDVDSVVANPALRSLTKLFLNSTWGKFAQNPCKNETRMVPNRNWIKAAQFLEEAGYEPKCYEEWGDTHILVSRQPMKAMATTSRFANIVYGALTTSAARVDLFNAMKLVGAENLIYCDTDSIIFRQKKGTDPLAPLKGEALGQMTNEVPKGWKIAEIVTLAPKVYSYKMVNTTTGEYKHVSKAKGITLNYETCERVNFETMKQLIQDKLDGLDRNIIVSRMRMKRGTNFLDGLESINEAKRIKCVMDKGIFDERGCLAPFGFVTDDGDLIHDYSFHNKN